MTQTKQTEEQLLRIELQLLEQLFVQKFVDGATIVELAPLRRQILSLEKKAVELGQNAENEGC